MIRFSKLLLFFVLTVQSLFGEGREASTTDTLKILQDNYSACLFEIIPIENRITILNVFLNDGVEDRNWEFSYGTLSTGDTFFLKHFIASTPRAERLRLLKDGFMANNYRWLRVLYQKSTGLINMDVSFQEVAPIFMLVGSWVMEHFNALQSEPIFTFIETFGFDDVEGFTTIRYSPGQQPFFLGIADKEITLNTGSETQTRILQSRTDFLENGKILFNNLYQLTDLRTYISAQGTSAPTRTGTFEYLQSYTPFEPIVIISGGQNNLGLGEGQETVVPAIVALAYQKSLLEEELQHQLRQFGNAVMIAGGVLAAPFSGGTSLAAVSAAIATGGIAVGAIDGYLQQKLRAGEISASGELYQAWNTFYLTYGIVDAGVGGTTMAVGAFNTLKTVNLAKSYNRFNSALKNMSLELRTGLSGDWNTLKTAIKGGNIINTGNLVKYSNLRNFLGDGKLKSYLNNQEIFDFGNILKTADEGVLKAMDEFKNVDEFAEMVRGYKDNSTAFTTAIKKLDDFNSWLKFWKITPLIENSLSTIRQLRNGNKLLPIGEATEIQLASIHAYTVNGNFINVPYRYKPEWFGEYNTRAVKHINEGLNELRKLDSRLYQGRVFSGKTFSVSDFESKFVGGIDKIHTYPGYMSTSKLESVAEGFIDLTKQWATSGGEKVAVIQRVVSKNGVYIDDISDWGKNLGKTNHADAAPAIQIQEEVLLNSEKLKQISEPIPIMENGAQKTVGGLKAYYVDFIEL